MIVTLNTFEPPEPTTQCWWVSSAVAAPINATGIVAPWTSNADMTLAHIEFTGTFTRMGHRFDCRCQTCRPDIHISAVNTWTWRA